MDDREKYINNHFIQKALAKNFAINGKLTWKIYRTNKKGKFSIKSKNQPIAKDYFYSEEIEKSMNILENKGILIIQKIALEGNQINKEVILSKKELRTLKYYCLLSSLRTNKIRNNIKELTGDSLFNEIMKKDGRNAKEIQEEQISLLVDSFENKEQEVIEHKEENSLKNYFIQQIKYTLNSRLLIFKFDKPKLFLLESLLYIEVNPSNNKIMYEFMPISSNIGIAFYYDPIMTRGVEKRHKSIIFKNDISYARHKVEYKNFDLMKKESLNFIEKNTKTKDLKEEEAWNRIFWSLEARKYDDKSDKYIYEVLEEQEAIADACNAMALIHNDNSILIYQKEKDIEDAEKEIKKRGIFRIENNS